MLVPTFSAFVVARPPDRRAESVASAKSKEDPMVSNTAVLLLSVGCLLTMPALALAQDDLMAKARQQFEPIPMAAPELPGNAACGNSPVVLSAFPTGRRKSIARRRSGLPLAAAGL
jgi:hypothetical protein